VIALTFYFTILKPPPREINGPENEKKVVKKTIPKEQNLIVKKGESEQGIKSKIIKKEETSEPKKSESESQSKKNEKEKVKNVPANPPLKKEENSPKNANSGISSPQKNTSILFSSFPASDVYWNGIKLGNTTQVFKKKFPSGTYTFTFKIEGYESKERVIIVKGERELTAHYKFRPFGFLTLTAKPFAEFFINNKSFGTNPIYQKKLPAGSYIIEAVKPGYKKERKEINIKPLKKSFINFTMKKEEK